MPLPMDCDAFLQQCLLLDLETSGERILKIGALWNGRVFERRGRFAAGQALRELQAFAAEARYLLGHNLLGHDLPIIRGLAPELAILRKPVVDTLFLSPLSFPEYPYHRLVKDYKLVRESINDPTADARLAATVFRDQWQSFTAMRAEAGGALLSFYRFALAAAEGGEGGEAGIGTESSGLARVFAMLGAVPLSAPEWADSFRSQVRDRVCHQALDPVLEPAVADPRRRLPFAYALAWLRVAGANSILPPWVLHRFPAVRELLRTLRDRPCADPSCRYCRTGLDPHVQLRRTFGFSTFRAQPTDQSGAGLQEQIVRHALGDRPLLAVLPTGGGKSLCYQLPALVRHFRRGLLTIVISPLQALMKDQVDNLAAKTGSPYGAALYGLLTGPERGEVLERIRLGDVALLYVAPEQLRNRSFREAIRHREIGSWVFDEAHCLSKWGHDFRPDYWYAGRFIREFAEQQAPAGTPREAVEIPPIACFTATAKREVKQEILEFFRSELGQELELFEAGVERDNLHFEVHTVPRAQKFALVHELLSTRLPPHAPGSAIVYTATRRGAAALAEYLQQQQWAAAAFHGGLNPVVKRAVQEAFLGGEVKVIAATNAFGMGIDKEDVRLVLHADIPGSLENYLQEAGRAGRDHRDAQCILLYEESDIETQFQLGALAQLSHRDIVQILRGLRKSRRGKGGEVVLTAGELLSDEDLETSFDRSERQAPGKVKAAISWLERAGFVERNENRTRVFQGRLAVPSIEEARRRIDQLQLPAANRARWLAVLEALFNAPRDAPMSADELAELPAFKADRLAAAATPPPPADARAAAVETEATAATRKSGEAETAGQRVLRALHGMSEAGLIEQGLMFTAFVRHKVKNPCLRQLADLGALETDLLDELRLAAPDAAEQGWLPLSLRRLNQRLLDRGHACTPEVLRTLIKSLSLDGRGLAGGRGSLEYRHQHGDQYRVKLLRGWDALAATARRRRQVAQVLLQCILARVPAQAPPSAELLVDFSSSDLVKALRGHLYLGHELKDPLAAVDRGLMFLHEQRVITLQQGLSVFRQAMTIRILPQGRGRRYSKIDYEPLAQHGRERIFQVHVMQEYARLGLERVRSALELVLAYFTLPRTEFIGRFFPGRKDMLERATSEESFRRIVESLKNPDQAAVVAADETHTGLILAGPGSGKTRVVVHRCAYLLRVLRVPARGIVILCFNQYAARTLRRRLHLLVGDDARGVLVQTYHGLAMRLTGTSFAELAAAGRGEKLPFDHLIPAAVRLLRGETETVGLAADEVRDRLLAGVRHILVDEYQDIDDWQYQLISALAGRTEADPESRLNLLAVGDDDQNIYSFRGANVEFIRRFEADYQARIHHLLENYRSSKAIVAVANRLIESNRDRMKADLPIRVNAARDRDAPGGRWEALDPLARGRVQVLTATDERTQIAAILGECRRLRSLDPELRWSGIAVLARTRSTLAAVRRACEHLGIPLTWSLGATANLPALHRLREIDRFLEVLNGERDHLACASDLLAWVEADAAAAAGTAATATGGGAGVIEGLAAMAENPWHRLLSEFLRDWREATGDAPVPAGAVIEELYAHLEQSRREQALGRGLFLGTVHAAKGMEFAHVLVPDGDWPRPASAAAVEEERRVCYVAMTRAAETFCLLRRSDHPNPHLDGLAGDFLVVREGSRELLDDLPDLDVHYDPLGLQSLDIGHAGSVPETHPIHRRLAALRPGSRLTVAATPARLELHDGCGECVARFSRQGVEAWHERIDQVLEVRVLGLLRRRRRDEQPPFQNRCRAESWELPWVEIVSRRVPGARDERERPADSAAAVVPRDPKTGTRGSLPGNRN